VFHIRSIALITGLLPIIAAHTSFVIAAIYEHVPWCNPYWHSCMSISATGRNSPEYYFFKATMIPAAIMMILFWQTIYRWLMALGDRPSWQTRAIPTVGFIAALCLILYTTVLGASGDIFHLERRIGVVIYFTFTYLAQLLLTRRVLKLNRITQIIPSAIYSSMFYLVTAVWVIGLLSLLLNVFHAAGHPLGSGGVGGRGPDVIDPFGSRPAGLILTLASRP
jgi:hypothetical protein